MMEPPKHIKGAARRVWKRLAAAVGLRLNPATADAFEILVQTWADYQAICEEVRALGPGGLVHKNSNGMIGIHPLEKIRHTRHGELVTLCKQWGLTPATADQAGGEMSDDEVTRWARAEAILLDGDNRPAPNARMQKALDFQRFLADGKRPPQTLEERKAEALAFERL